MYLLNAHVNESTRGLHALRDSDGWWLYDGERRLVDRPYRSLRGIQLDWAVDICEGLCDELGEYVVLRRRTA